MSSLETHRLTQLVKLHFDALHVHIVGLSELEGEPRLSRLGIEIISNAFQYKRPAERFDMVNKCIQFAELPFDVKYILLKAQTAPEVESSARWPRICGPTYPVSLDDLDESDEDFDAQSIAGALDSIGRRSSSFHQPEDRPVFDRALLLNSSTPSPTRDIDRVGCQSQPLEREGGTSMSCDMVRIATRSPPGYEEEGTPGQRRQSSPNPTTLEGIDLSRYEPVTERRSGAAPTLKVPSSWAAQIAMRVKRKNAKGKSRASTSRHSASSSSSRHKKSSSRAEEEAIDAEHFSEEDRASIDDLVRKDIDIGEGSCLIPENLKRLNAEDGEDGDSTPRSNAASAQTPSSAARASATPGSGLLSEPADFVDAGGLSRNYTRPEDVSSQPSPSSTTQELSHSERPPPRPPLRRESFAGQPIIAPETLPHLADSYFPISSPLSPLDPTTEQIRPGSSGCSDVGIPEHEPGSLGSAADSTETIIPPATEVPRAKKSFAEFIETLRRGRILRGWPSFTAAVQRLFAGKRRRATRTDDDEEALLSPGGQPGSDSTKMPLSVAALTTSLMDSTGRAVVDEAQRLAAESQHAAWGP